MKEKYAHIIVLLVKIKLEIGLEDFERNTLIYCVYFDFEYFIKTQKSVF